MIARRKVHVVTRIGAAGRAHIFRVVGILEREGDAVHRHLRKVGIAAVLRIQFSGTFQGIRLAAKFFADLWRSRGKRAQGGRFVELALACHRTFAADIEHSQRAHLAGVGDSDGHPKLLLDRRIGCRGFHAPKLNRRRLSRVARREARRGCHSRLVFAVVWKELRRHVLRDQLIAGAVVRPGAPDVRLHQRPAADLTFLNGSMHVGNRRLLEMKSKWLRLRAVAADREDAYDEGNKRCLGK